ncbi:YggT family protein [Paenibacillus larvae]
MDLEYSIITTIGLLSRIYFYMFIFYVLLSWVPNARESYIGELLGKIVEPYLSIFRRFIPPLSILDISPIVAIIAFNFVVSGLIVVVRFLFDLFT